MCQNESSSFFNYLTVKCKTNLGHRHELPVSNFMESFRKCRLSSVQRTARDRGLEQLNSWTTLAWYFLMPLDNIREALEAYFHLGFNDKQLEQCLGSHYDTELYGLGCVLFSFRQDLKICLKRVSAKGGMKLTNLSESKWIRVMSVLQYFGTISIPALFFDGLLSHGSNQNWINGFSTATEPVLGMIPKKFSKMEFYLSFETSPRSSTLWISRWVQFFLSLSRHDLIYLRG